MSKESWREYIERKKREAQAKLDTAKREHPERFQTPVVLPGTHITARDLEKSSGGRVVSGQGDND